MNVRTVLFILVVFVASRWEKWKHARSPSTYQPRPVGQAFVWSNPRESAALFLLSNTSHAHPYPGISAQTGPVLVSLENSSSFLPIDVEGKYHPSQVARPLLKKGRENFYGPHKQLSPPCSSPTDSPTHWSVEDDGTNLWKFYPPLPDPNKISPHLFPYSSRFQDYDLLKSIGSGAYAEVYAARERYAPFRKVAVKIFKEIEKKSSFDEEKDFMESLGPKVHIFGHPEGHLYYRYLPIHPNIVHYLGGHPISPPVTHEDEELKAFILYEILKLDLYDFLLFKVHGWDNWKPDYVHPRNLSQIILYQTFKGIEYLHDKGIIHRDIKPGNFIIDMKNPLPLNSNNETVSWTDSVEELDDELSPTGPYIPPEYRIKLVDLGMAIRSGKGPEEYRTVVTTWYRPPEVFLGTYQSEHTTAIDVWAAGMMMVDVILGSALLQPLQSESSILAAGVFYHFATQKPGMEFPYSQWPDEKLWPGVTQYSKYNKTLQSVLSVWNNSENRSAILNVTSHSKLRELLGNQAYNLFDRMTRLRPQDRITIKEALQHPYFKGNYDES